MRKNCGKSDAPNDYCGNQGCLEVFARADAIAAACGKPGVEEAAAAALAGDLRARRGFQEAGRYLGIGASNVVVARVNRSNIPPRPYRCLRAITPLEV